MTDFDTLLSVETGDTVRVTVDDFENTQHPKEENPRTISGEVKWVKEDVPYSAGEIQRTVAVGDPWDEGCYIDLGDTAENKMTGGTYNSRKYTKAWRPRPGKDRLLLGKVSEASYSDVSENGCSNNE